MTFFFKFNKTHLLLLAVALVSLGIRVFLLDKRWINPDEGAHLMDAALLLGGKIPIVDFGSRQPFYVYMIALFLKLFGTGYVSGRLLPLTCSMLTGVMVFYIGRVLFDEYVGVLSCALYWMLPLELINSTVVKTEPLVTLLTCVSFYGLIRFWKSGQAAWLIGAGVFASLGYYVRQSSLTGILCAFLVIAVIHRLRIREMIKSLGVYAAGYLAVVLAVMVYYLRFMPFEEMLTNYQISPLGTVLKTINRIVDLNVPVTGAKDAVFQLSGDYTLYYTYIYNVFRLHSFLFVGMLFSVMAFGISLLFASKEKVNREELLSRAFLYFWVLSLFAGYTAYFASRGFYIDYFREFLPPLVLIFSAWVFKSLPGSVVDKERITQRLILFGLPLLGVIFFLQDSYPIFYGTGFYASITIALVSLFTFIRTFESTTRRIYFAISLIAIIAFILFPQQTVFSDYLTGPIPSLGMIGVIYGVTWIFLKGRIRPLSGDYLRFVTLSIAAAALVVSVCRSALLLGVSYDTPWSPGSLKAIVTYLQNNTRPGDEIMSGAVIWEFQALRRPFHMISHPLIFEFPVSHAKQNEVRTAVAANPPKIIILDGVTEKTYFRQIPSISDLLHREYRLVLTEGTKQNPIRVFRLIERPIQPHGSQIGTTDTSSRMHYAGLEL